MNKKTFFYRLPHSDFYKPESLYHAGTAIAAVIATGQQVFAEVRTDEYARVWTDYYTLNPEGV